MSQLNYKVPERRFKQYFKGKLLIAAPPLVRRSRQHNKFRRFKIIFEYKLLKHFRKNYK